MNSIFNIHTNDRPSQIALLEAHKRYAEAHISRLRKRQSETKESLAVWSRILNQTKAELESLKGE